MLQKQISTYEDDMAKLSGKESDQAQANGDLDNITENKEAYSEEKLALNETIHIIM